MTHWRAMLPPVAPSGWAQPMVTSSTSPSSMPARFTASATTCPPMSAPCVRLKAPRTALPIGVRAVETMTASTMGRVLSSGIGCSFGGGLDGGLGGGLGDGLGGHLGLLPLLVDQLLLRQLADRGPRQGVAELQMGRHLVPANLVGQEGAQLVQGESSDA